MTPRFNRICRVCGDRATAFNFGGLSCDSCKIFFRRNGSHAVKYKCNLSEQCEMNIATRRNCPKCRLKKCFEIGMERNWFETIDQTRDISELKRDFPVDKTKPQYAKNKTDLRTTLREDIDLSKNIVELSPLSNSNELTESEWHHIGDIENAMQIFVDESSLPVVGCAQNLSQGYSYFGLYARKIIKFCKYFPAYNSLSQVDQLTVLKPFYMEFLTTRYAFQDKNKFNGVPLIENESSDKVIVIPYELYPQFEGSFYCALFLDSLNREIEHDPVIKNLLIAQFLFSSRQNLKKLETFRYQYHSYHYILKRYLRYKYKDNLLGDKKYNQLIHLVNKYYPLLKECVLKMVKEFVDIKVAGQVMAELHSSKFA